MSSQSLGLSYKAYAKRFTSRLQLQTHTGSFSLAVPQYEQAKALKSKRQQYAETYLSELHHLIKVHRVQRDPKVKQQARQKFNTIPLPSIEEDEHFRFSLQVLRIATFFKFGEEENTFYFIQHILKHAYLLDGYGVYQFLKAVDGVRPSQGREMILKVLPRLQLIATRNKSSSLSTPTSEGGEEGSNALLEELTAVEAMEMMGILRFYHLLPNEEHQSLYTSLLEDFSETNTTSIGGPETLQMLEEVKRYLLQVITTTVSYLHNKRDMANCLNLIYYLPLDEGEAILSALEVTSSSSPRSRRSVLLDLLEEGGLIDRVRRHLLRDSLLRTIQAIEFPSMESLPEEKDVSSLLTAEEREVVRGLLREHSTEGGSIRGDEGVYNTPALRQLLEDTLQDYKLLLKVVCRVLNRMALQQQLLSSSFSHRPVNIFGKHRRLVQGVVQYHLRWSEPLRWTHTEAAAQTPVALEELTKAAERATLLDPLTELPYLLQLLDRATVCLPSHTTTLGPSSLLLPECGAVRTAVERLAMEVTSSSSSVLQFPQAVRVVQCYAHYQPFQPSFPPDSILRILEAVLTAAPPETLRVSPSAVYSFFPPVLSQMKRISFYKRNVFAVDYYIRLLDSLAEIAAHLLKEDHHHKDNDDNTKRLLSILSTLLQESVLDSYTYFLTQLQPQAKRGGRGGAEESLHEVSLMVLLSSRLLYNVVRLCAQCPTVWMGSNPSDVCIARDILPRLIVFVALHSEDSTPSTSTAPFVLRRERERETMETEVRQNFNRCFEVLSAKENEKKESVSLLLSNWKELKLM